MALRNHTSAARTSLATVAARKDLRTQACSTSNSLANWPSVTAVITQPNAVGRGQHTAPNTGHGHDQAPRGPITG